MFFDCYVKVGKYYQVSYLLKGFVELISDRNFYLSVMSKAKKTKNSSTMSLLSGKWDYITRNMPYILFTDIMKEYVHNMDGTRNTETSVNRQTVQVNIREGDMTMVHKFWEIFRHIFSRKDSRSYRTLMYISLMCDYT